MRLRLGTLLSLENCVNMAIIEKFADRMESTSERYWGALGYSLRESAVIRAARLPS